MTNSRRTDLRVSEIISTEKRKEILNEILAQKGYFSVPDIHRALLARKVGLRITAVLNVVKSLHYAGFLSEKREERLVKRTGRVKNLYKVVG